MRAKRVFKFTLLAGALAIPFHADALGLGRLTLQSGLGQPLSARIELSAAQKEELDTLVARVASPGVYRDNNVQYSAALSRARVSVEMGPNNVPFLRIVTGQPVNEPYLDLLVEVSWSTGRVTRDYTFLLDPPGTAVAEAQPVEPVAPIRAQATTPRANRAARRGPDVAANAPAAGSTPSRDAGAGAGGGAAAAGSAPAAAGGDTYTVRNGDSLSKIARQYKPDSVSLEQMLVAMFRANESAFDGRNMNRLRSGQILTIPSAEQAAGLQQPEATEVVKVQAADWRGFRDRVAAGAPTTDAAEARQSSGGKIGAAVEDKGASAGAPTDRVRISSGSGKGAGTARTADDSTAKDRALREANERIAVLEKTVRDMQAREAARGAQVTSPSMAALQSNAEADKAKSAPALKSEAPRTEPAKAEPAKAEPPKAAMTPPAATPAAPAPAVSAPVPAAKAPAATPPAPAPSTAPAPAASKATEPKAEPKSAAPAPAVVPPIAVAPTPATPEAKAPEAKAPEPKAATPAPEPKSGSTATPPAKTVPPAPKVAAPSSFVDDVISNTPTWAIGAGALGILAGIAAIVAARRRKTTKFEDSIISGTDIKTNTVFGSTGGGVVNTGDNSLASDFSREGLGNIDTDEVDPIAEAEVYLAYGRDAQAEEILKDALKKDSQRQEIYLKLLEIHAQHNKPSAFETVASELYSVSGGQGETWQKAMALGRQLDPSNPMFSEAGSAAAFAAAPRTVSGDTAAPTLAEAAPAKSDAHVFSVPPDLKPEHVDKDALDFHLDEDISLSPTSTATKTPASILAGAEQELARSTKHPAEVSRAASALGMGAASAASIAAAAAKTEREKEPPPVSFAPESIPRFDLDFKLDRPHPAAAAPKPSSSENPFGAPAHPNAPAPQLARPAAAIELDKLDLAFDPQRSTFEDPTPSVLDGQWHDAATKLDLAKAYQEMGDVEGAREILQEVLHEGDDQQKAEADALLGKLA